MPLYIWTKWRFVFTKINKFSLGFDSVTAMTFSSFEWLVEMNMIIYLSDQTIFIVI